MHVWQTHKMKLSAWEVHPIFGTNSNILADDYLFHYTALERCAAIGLTGSLALGPLTPLNDPRESQLRQVGTTRTGDLGSLPPRVTEEERQTFEAELWRLRSRVRLTCCTVDKVDGANSERDDWRGYAHSRMWTQYAAGHTGVCLVFDRRALLDAAIRTFGASLHHGAVEYTSGFDAALCAAESVDFHRPDPGLHHRSRVIPSLFVKNRDWSAEFEYRLIVDEWGDTTCALPIAGNLTGVALGASFKAHQIPVIADLAQRFDLGDSVAQMIVNCGVLQAWPSRDRTGALRIWTDADTRSRGLIFDPEQDEVG